MHSIGQGLFFAPRHVKTEGENEWKAPFIFIALICLLTHRCTTHKQTDINPFFLGRKEHAVRAFFRPMTR
ncbi:hypothetical protein CN373_02020 [Bacillus cereus]|nr:hypothetical protein CN373_02020 [Bacillus cereus]PGZ18784.1 hypothetical protein COE46_06185 [Bacillus cereus]